MLGSTLTITYLRQLLVCLWHWQAGSHHHLVPSLLHWLFYFNYYKQWRKVRQNNIFVTPSLDLKSEEDPWSCQSVMSRCTNGKISPNLRNKTTHTELVPDWIWTTIISFCIVAFRWCQNTKMLFKPDHHIQMHSTDLHVIKVYNKSIC